MTTAEHLKRARHAQLPGSAGKGSIGANPPPPECDMFHYTVDMCRIWALTEHLSPSSFTISEEVAAAPGDH